MSTGKSQIARPQQDYFVGSDNNKVSVLAFGGNAAYVHANEISVDGMTFNTACCFNFEGGKAIEYNYVRFSSGGALSNGFKGLFTPTSGAPHSAVDRKLLAILRSVAVRARDENPELFRSGEVVKTRIAIDKIDAEIAGAEDVLAELRDRRAALVENVHRNEPQTDTEGTDEAEASFRI